MSEPTLEQLLEELDASQRQVTAILSSMEPVQDWQREPVEWSFRYIAAHLATVEQTCHLRRVKRIAAGGNPRLARYNYTAADFAQIDLRDSLHAWRAARQQLIDFVSRLSERELHFTGAHEGVGAITVLDALQEILDQDRGNFRHVCQLIVDYHEESSDKYPEEHPARHSQEAQ